MEKRENKPYVVYAGLGANAPFNLTTDSDTTLNDTSFPLGISLHLVASAGWVSTKGNLNWDFIKYSEKTSAIFNGTFSFGITPIHNDYCFIGVYYTIGYDEIENYSYPYAQGGSINMLFNFSKRFGMFLNCDATYRGNENYKGDEEIAPYAPRFLDSWRICPSIGFAFTFLRGEAKKTNPLRSLYFR